MRRLYACAILLLGASGVAFGQSIAGVPDDMVASKVREAYRGYIQKGYAGDQTAVTPELKNLLYSAEELDRKISQVESLETGKGEVFRSRQQKANAIKVLGIAKDLVDRRLKACKSAKVKWSLPRFDSPESLVEGQFYSIPSMQVVEVVKQGNQFIGKVGLPSGVREVFVFLQKSQSLTNGGPVQFASHIPNLEDRSQNYECVFLFVGMYEHEQLNQPVPFLVQCTEWDTFIAAVPKEDREPQVAQSAPLIKRTWHSGDYSVEADLVAFDGRTVTIRKADGKEATVEAAKLDFEDRDWLKAYADAAKLIRNDGLVEFTDEVNSWAPVEKSGGFGGYGQE